MNRGFTLIEIILVCLVTLIIGSIVVGAFSQFNKRFAIQKDSEKVVSLLRKAEFDTLASRGETQYGVHFESDKTVLFSGNTYAVSPTNQSVIFQPAIAAGPISFSGGGSDVVFDRLTGGTSEPGSVTLSIVGLPSVSRIINISAEGVINIQ